MKQELLEKSLNRTSSILSTNSTMNTARSNTGASNRSVRGLGLVIGGKNVSTLTKQVSSVGTMPKQVSSVGMKSFKRGVSKLNSRTVSSLNPLASGLSSTMMNTTRIGHQEHKVEFPMKPITEIEKMNPFCVILWNGICIGETRAEEGTRNPNFGVQRFLIKTPFMEEYENSLLECTLRLEVYNKVFKPRVVNNLINYERKISNAFVMAGVVDARKAMDMKKLIQAAPTRIHSHGNNIDYEGNIKNAGNDLVSHITTNGLQSVYLEEDDTRYEERELIGVVILSGEELNTFFNQVMAQTKWFPIVDPLSLEKKKALNTVNASSSNLGVETQRSTRDFKSQKSFMGMGIGLKKQLSSIGGMGPQVGGTLSLNLSNVLNKRSSVQRSNRSIRGAGTQRSARTPRDNAVSIDSYLGKWVMVVLLVDG